MEQFVQEKINIVRETAVYNALHSVFINGAFSSLVINGVLNAHREDAPYITKLFYGVLDKSIQFDYIIGLFAKRKPQQSVQIIIKMGLYQILYMDVPPYAAVDKSVQLCKQLGKTGISGFVNAVLRKALNIKLPEKGEIDFSDYLSITYSYPKWAIKKLISQYDEKFVEDFFSADIYRETHIRGNLTNISLSDFEEKMSKIGYLAKTEYGYYVSHNQIESLSKSEYIIQSLPSIISVNSLLENINISSVLDLCSAPGGKAILIKQLTGAAVTACDLFPHRANLIEKFASKVGIKDINVIVNDATDLRIEWIDKFDFVLCDVPCSNFGVISSKPDIVLKKTSESIEPLKKLQYRILDTASHYVKTGGFLAYSTCTIFKDENEEIIEKFLSEHSDFTLDKMDNKYSRDGMIQILPQKENCGAFFAARLRRN